MCQNQTLPHHWIMQLSFMIRKELTARFQAAGHKIGVEEWAVLLLLWEQDGRASGEVAKITLRDKTTVTRLIDSLVKKELVTRKSDANDRRVTRIYLTGSGRDLKDVLLPISDEFMRQSLADIAPDDSVAMLRTLQQMAWNIEQVT